MLFICKTLNVAANGNSQQKKMVSSGGYIYEFFLSKCREAGNVSVLVESSPGCCCRHLNAKFHHGFLSFVLCYTYPSQISSLRNAFPASLPWSCVCHRDLPVSVRAAASPSFSSHSTDLPVNKSQGIYLTGLLSCSLQTADL